MDVLELYLCRSSMPAPGQRQPRPQKGPATADFEEEEEVGVPSMYQLETDAEPFACSCVTAKSGTCEVFCFLT